jgi:glycosyltransferase involved in cell wall biosynthesis
MTQLNTISVVMPYWRRPVVLKTNVERYRSFYPEIEIIVVDDGSGDVPDVDATIVSLPKKDHALNPCVAFNRGVEVASHPLIVLTNPEVLHRNRFLDRMQPGPNEYIAAACWGGWWYCHSWLMPKDEDVGRAPTPPGAGLHFCSMLHRSLYDKVGGFSEEYRNGQGYEDNDFLWKLHRAGAQFKIMDDCVTDHVHCPPSKWTGSNRELFFSKWPDARSK